MLKHYVKVFCIFLTLLGSGCSLQEHNLPDPEIPEVPEIPEIAEPETQVVNEFKVSTTGVRNEQGKLYLQGNVDQVDPTYTGIGQIGILVSSRVIESGPIYANPHYNNDPLLRFYLINEFGTDGNDNPMPLKLGSVSALEPFAFTELYFRTILILEDGRVNYGNVFHHSGLPLPANPTPWEINTNKIDIDGMNLSITKRGQIPAVECGFVLSYKEKESDKINNMPTISDEKLFANWHDNEGDYIGMDGEFGSNNSSSQKIEFNFKELYYRSYLISQDGSVVYGNVMHVQK